MKFARKCFVCKTYKKPSPTPVISSPRQSNLGDKVFNDNSGNLFPMNSMIFAKHFNKKIFATPGESPWYNGIWERCNPILTNIILKVRDDLSYQYEKPLHRPLMLKIPS